MNFNPNNQNTLLTKKVAALYEAMQKAGDSGLAFMVVDSLNSLANYARFLAEQEILIQQARITMDGEEFRQYVMELDRHRRALHEGLMARVNFANRLCVKMNTPVLAERVTEEDRETYFAFAKEVVDSYFGEAMQNGRLL